MNSPSANYRVQLSPTFTFRDLREIIPYLDALGISTIYAAPFFRARTGSTHGYDITSPLQINPEIGTLEELRELRQELKQRNMTWLQDIVPNHMAYDCDNHWLCNTLERGPRSSFAQMFDIDWNGGDAVAGKVMAPFLGQELEEALRQQEVKLVLEGGAIEFRYYDHRFPASEEFYPRIFMKALDRLRKENGDKHPAFAPLKTLVQAFERKAKDEEGWQRKKELLQNVLAEHPQVKEEIAGVLEQINASPEQLQRALGRQHFRLTHWRTTEREINYRRFFTINDLICLRMGDETVFSRYHRFIRQLCEEDLVQGLRVDHVDGLFDPAGYLERLRKLAGEDRYLIIEKILEWEEQLPLHWPIQGTSGYGFLATVNQLFTKPEGEDAITADYHSLTGEQHPYEEQVYQNKLFILKERMAGELQNLCRLLLERNLLPEQPQDAEPWREALSSFLAGFPVYRIYPQDFPLTERQQKVVMEAYETARKHCPNNKELDYLLSLFQGKAQKPAADMRYFLQRCQQFTGPLAAKGVEDTTFYTYNRLISHNEVGDSPQNFGIGAEEFHRRMQHRQRHFPQSINATATHDTKRGEDARMRINVLSEMPQQWHRKVKEWMQVNAGQKLQTQVPGPNEELFIYQALLGAWPVDGRTDESFLQRIRDYLEKVLREAKVHTTWSEPDEAYEQQVQQFVAAILAHAPFRASFDSFAHDLTFYGAIHSLGQSLLKVTAPGIPDIYQGTELWELSYVDPDNRRPVNYEARQQLVQEVEGVKAQQESYFQDLLENYRNGQMKLFTLHKALQERRQHPEVFTEGEYLPISPEGKQQESLLSFARKLEDEWYLVVVPKQVVLLCEPGEFPLGKDVWKDAKLPLPENAPKKWVNIYTGGKLTGKDALDVAEVLASFPVALLRGISQ